MDRAGINEIHSTDIDRSYSDNEELTNTYIDLDEVQSLMTIEITEKNKQHLFTSLPTYQLQEMTAELRSLRQRVALADDKNVNLYPPGSASGTPCQRCHGDVFEFSIPNGLWNRVTKSEAYLCLRCFYELVVEQFALADELADLLRFISDKGPSKNEWFYNQMQTRISTALTRYQAGGPSLAPFALAWAEATREVRKYYQEYLDWAGANSIGGEEYLVLERQKYKKVTDADDRMNRCMSAYEQARATPQGE